MAKILILELPPSGGWHRYPPKFLSWTTHFSTSSAVPSNSAVSSDALESPGSAGGNIPAFDKGTSIYNTAFDRWRLTKGAVRVYSEPLINHISRLFFYPMAQIHFKTIKVRLILKPPQTTVLQGGGVRVRLATPLPELTSGFSNLHRILMSTLASIWFLSLY